VARKSRKNQPDEPEPIQTVKYPATGYTRISNDNEKSEDSIENQAAIIREYVKDKPELMVETVCSMKETIRIGGEDKPRELVKSRILKVDQFHVEYVLDAMSKNTTEVRNIKGYLLTAIYNAPNTIGNYYKSRVNHDFYGGT